MLPQWISHVFFSVRLWTFWQGWNLNYNFTSCNLILTAGSSSAFSITALWSKIIVSASTGCSKEQLRTKLVCLQHISHHLIIIYTACMPSMLRKSDCGSLWQRPSVSAMQTVAPASIRVFSKQFDKYLLTKMNSHVFWELTKSPLSPPKHYQCCN